MRHRKCSPRALEPPASGTAVSTLRLLPSEVRQGFASWVPPSNSQRSSQCGFCFVAHMALPKSVSSLALGSPTADSLPVHTWASLDVQHPSPKPQPMVSLESPVPWKAGGSPCLHCMDEGSKVRGPGVQERRQDRSPAVGQLAAHAVHQVG